MSLYAEPKYAFHHKGALSPLRPDKKKKRRGLSAFMLQLLAEKKELNFLPQQYADVSQFLNAFNIIPSKLQHWRLCERSVGYIHGFPSSFGFLTATNGILCYVVKLDGSLFQGHLENFVKVENEPEHVEVPESDHVAKPRDPKPRKLSIYDID